MEISSRMISAPYSPLDPDRCVGDFRVLEERVGRRPWKWVLGVSRSAGNKAEGKARELKWAERTLRVRPPSSTRDLKWNTGPRYHQGRERTP